MSLYDRIPGYLLEKFQLTSTVVFAALFSLVFMLISIPFSDNVWFSLNWTESFAYTVVFFLISLLVVCISKRIMFKTRNRIVLNLLQYILWNLVEVVIICALYTLFTVQGGRLGIIQPPDDPTERIFLSAMAYVIISLGVPYVVAALYFAINDKNNTIRLLNYGNVVSDSEPSPLTEKKITLTDNNGLIKLSISLSNLFYIESDDNYIKVWYEDSHGVLKQYMLRCRLKTVEDSFADSSLIRCHRKYIVNMDKVKVLYKEKDGYVLELDNDTIPPLQITKTYEDSVLARFNSSSYKG